MGEVSAAAEAFGVARGMRLGEALARCPELRLVPPDPERVRALWEAVLDRLERIGAAVESDRAGRSASSRPAACEGSTAAASRGCSPRRAGRCGRGAARAPRPAASRRYAAALRARPRRRGRAGGRSRRGASAAAFLAPLPVALLRSRLELQALPEVLERLGIRTLGELAELPRAAVAERFGHPGLLALDLARGRDTPLEPRRPPEPVSERLELPEAASGPQLERALELLVARVLARPERRGRSLRALAVSARFVAGGTLARRGHAAPRERRPGADPARRSRRGWRSCRRRRSRSRSRSRRFGPPAHDQGALLDEARRRATGAARRGGAPGAPGGGRRRRAARARGRPGLADPRAAGRAGALPRADAGGGRRGSRRLGTSAARSPSGAGARRAALAVGGVPVEAVREEWVVEDRWWTGRPLRAPLFRARPGRRPQRGRLPRPRGRPLGRRSEPDAPQRAGARRGSAATPESLKTGPGDSDIGTMSFELDAALADAVALGASDLHLKVPSIPRVRIDGALQELPGYEPLQPEDTAAIKQRVLAGASSSSSSRRTARPTSPTTRARLASASRPSRSAALRPSCSG